MKRTKDIIEAKQKELEVLQAESNGALDIVTSTINQLLAVNEKIETNMSEIAEAKAKLAVTEEGLTTTKERNSKIINKFRALIED